MKDAFDYFRDVQAVFERANSTATLGIDPDEAAMIIMTGIQEELFADCVEDYVGTRMDVLEGVAYDRVGTRMQIDYLGLINELTTVLRTTPEGQRTANNRRIWTKGDPWPPPGVTIPPKNKA